MPVDPYLVYAYWDLASEGSPTAGARAIMRFHESSPGTNGSRSFDVDVNLAAGNWYVRLWSPDKIYQADLGLRTEDGAFIGLAHSNIVRTPPSAAVPAPAPRPVWQGPVAQRAAESERPLVSTAEEASVVRDDLAEGQPAPKEQAVDPAPDRAWHLEEIFATHEELPSLAEYEPLLAAPNAVNEQGELFEESVASAPFQRDDLRMNDLGMIDLAEISPTYVDLPQIDLTQYSEERFAPGVSSARSGE